MFAINYPNPGKIMSYSTASQVIDLRTSENVFIAPIVACDDASNNERRPNLGHQHDLGSQEGICIQLDDVKNVGIKKRCHDVTSTTSSLAATVVFKAAIGSITAGNIAGVVCFDSTSMGSSIAYSRR